MTTSEHPVILGDLFVPLSPSWPDAGPTHRPATVADLVSALRAEGVLVVEKVDGVWPEELLERVAKTFHDAWERGNIPDGDRNEWADIGKFFRDRDVMHAAAYINALAEVQP